MTSAATTTITRMAAWTALALIIFVTVSPIALRPHDILPVNVDRGLAFALMGFLFTRAHPRQWRWIAALIILSAFPIEYLQHFSASRHPHLEDALFKAVGAAVGVAFARLLAPAGPVSPR